MLDKLAALLWDGQRNEWGARARGSNAYVFDADAEQAIINAVEKHENELRNLPQADRSGAIGIGEIQGNR